MTFQSRTRTMLYYPTFTPPQQWLRQAILYSDQVGSIIPVDYKRELTKASPDIAYLEQEGEFKSFDPSKALNLSRSRIVHHE